MLAGGGQIERAQEKLAEFQLGWRSTTASCSERTACCRLSAPRRSNASTRSTSSRSAAPWAYVRDRIAVRRLGCGPSNRKRPFAACDIDARDLPVASADDQTPCTYPGFGTPSVRATESPYEAIAASLQPAARAEPAGGREKLRVYCDHPVIGGQVDVALRSNRNQRLART